MYVYTLINKYIGTRNFSNTSTLKHKLTRTQAHARTIMFTRVYTCSRTNNTTPIYMSTYTRAQIRSHKHTCTHMHTTHTHSRTHTQIFLIYIFYHFTMKVSVSLTHERKCHERTFMNSQVHACKNE